jgi:thiosulfate/3-mercaptopyruvate sulfurtransferase
MNWNSVLRLGAISAVALAIGFAGSSFQRTANAAQTQADQKPAGDQMFAPGSLLEPADLVNILSHSKQKPTIVQVGFDYLYNSAHIPGALYLGPGRTAAGLEKLEKWAQNFPRNNELVIYCGCCPWDKCPNIRPAYEALRKMGFTQLKVVHLTQGFAKDWVEKGFPVEKK